MFQKQLKIFILVLTVILLALVIGTIASADSPSIDFESASKDIAMMHNQNLFQGSYEQLVTFDTKLAYKQGFSPESIKLAEELTAFTNDLIVATQKARQSGTTNLTELDVDVQKYTLLANYFESATSYAKNTNGNTSQIFELESNGDKANNIATESWASEYYCGVWWHPVPSSAAPWNTFGPYSSQSAAETQLEDWGYHSTPGWAGGGFTRPQTYKWWLCGWSTFRDHGYVYNSGGWKVREQNYTGSIPGEPNPEVWQSGPWPYPTWPAYVSWWHDNY